MTAEEFKQEAESMQENLRVIALRYLHNKEDAEDIVQDVLLKLWGMRDDLHRPVVALARVLTRNFCIDYIRRHPTLLELNAMKAQDTPSPNPQNEMIDRMIKVMELLPPQAATHSQASAHERSEFYGNISTHRRQRSKCQTDFMQGQARSQGFVL